MSGGATSNPFGLTPEQLAARRHSIGSSDANIIAGRNKKSLQNLWLEKATGESDRSHLDDQLPILIGQATEDLHRWWFNRQTGEEVVHLNATYSAMRESWRTCTPDGYVESYSQTGAPALFEAKHVGGNEPLDVIVDRYMAQLHHGMYVMGVEQALLSIFIGTQRWAYYRVELDPFYLQDLLEAEEHFWWTVQNDRPGDLKLMRPPEPPEVGLIEAIDMSDNIHWKAAARAFLETQPAVDVNKRAAKRLRDCVPKNAENAIGHGVLAKRDAKGALRIYIKDDPNE